MGRGAIVRDRFALLLCWTRSDSEQSPHFLPATPISAFVDRDARQPGAQRAIAIIFLQMAEGGDKAILREIKRLVRVDHETANQTENRCLMAMHNLGERRLATTQGQRREFTVRTRLEIQTHRTSSVSA